ncbi:hypothetical protein BUALT_Bualt14G0101800 [Buddleja alternifolia]|uniref:NEDD8-activating enzyme E1 catalytic subunit n=1 Tax=Buddleja alternifolia TaxID=168488 RepID=A0AAV6WRV6_9LAMI|nr:hypothetical protein BUALT_Bualt14G0101800 [Buddleja alternifolia]
MERVNDVNITPHFCRIEDKPLDFYSDFSIIVLGLDSVEARSYINVVDCGFLEYDSDDTPREETVKPMVDGGTEGFKGHARIIVPGTTPCFECTIWLFPPQVKFPLCTLAETPRNAAHCIEYAHLIKRDEVHNGKSFDPDNPEDMQWVYSEAVKRAELFGIPGVTYSLTQGDSCYRFYQCYYLSCMCFGNLEDCFGMQRDFIKLLNFIEQLEDHPTLLLTRVSVTHRGKNLYMQAPPILEEMTRSSLDLPLFDLSHPPSEEKPVDSRRLAGLILKNWMPRSSIESQLPQKSLQKVAGIELPQKHWPELIAVVQGMNANEDNTDVRLAATRALYNALGFAQANFSNDMERDYIMRVVCESRQAAYECLALMTEYTNLLRNGILETYSGIFQGFKNSTKTQLLIPYATHILQFLDSIYVEKDMDDVVMKTAIGVLGDLADTLGSNAGSLIQQSLSSKEFFSSLIGSGALAFFKVAIMAFVLYIPGAIFACNSTITPLLSKSTRAALLGKMLATKGCRFLSLWKKTVAPLISCACTFCLFKAFRNFILRHENGEKRIFVFLPVYYGISAGLLCLFSIDEVIPYYMRGFRRTIIIAVAMATLLGALLSLVSFEFSVSISDVIAFTISKKKNLLLDLKYSCVLVLIAAILLSTRTEYIVHSENRREMWTLAWSFPAASISVCFEEMETHLMENQNNKVGVCGRFIPAEVAIKMRKKIYGSSGVQ